MSSMDLLLLVSIALISFGAKGYSSTVSLVFETLFIKFFRTLKPSYIASYLRSVVISWLSFRNQAISFVGLSFLNSGIIPNFQALGLILGSYLGLSLSILFLNFAPSPLKFALVVLALIFGVFSNKNKALQISKMFFFAAMILFGFELLIHALSTSVLVIHLGVILTFHRLSILALVAVLCLIFRNSFTVLAILFALYLNSLIVDDQVMNAILAVMIFNSFWYMIGTRKAHRETKAVSYAVVLISIFTGIVVIAAQMLFPDWFVIKNQSPLSFFLNCIALSVVTGVIGYILNFRLQEFTNQFFPAGETKEARQIQIFTSKNNYPITYLVEFFEQEYKKLFALINSIQSLILNQWVSSDDVNQEKIQKYTEISKRILKEMEELEIQMNQSERTLRQAQKIFSLREKLNGLKSLVHTLDSVYQIKLKILDNNHLNLKENKALFVSPIQKIQEFCEYIFSSYIETEDTEVDQVHQVTALLGQLEEDLAKFRTELINLKESVNFTKEEMELIYDFQGQIQLLNLAIHKIAR